MNTNIGFLQRLAAHPQFIEGDVHTGFIEVTLLIEQPIIRLVTL